MDDEQHQERSTRRERGWGVGSYLLWATVVLVVYVLSIGPAAWLHEKTTNATLKTTLELLYAPVVSLIKDTPLRPAGEWWIKLWCRS
jgi:hypothetical protein